MSTFKDLLHKLAYSELLHLHKSFEFEKVEKRLLYIELINENI